LTTPRLGANFGKLWAAQGISGVGDGVYASALPLLAASLTRNAVAISAVLVAEWLPWVLFGLLAGVLVDRWDRCRTMWTVDALRLLIVGGLGVAVLLDRAGIPLLLAVAFLLGTGKTFGNIAGQATIPMLVTRDSAQLGRANARLQATNMLGTQFTGPPLGGILFGLSASLPFLVDAASFGVSSALVARIRPPSAASAEPVAARPAGVRAAVERLRHEVSEGLGWLMGNRVLRTLTLLTAAVNLAGAMCLATLVLFVQRKLGLGNVGYGVILACMAVGGAAGSIIAGRVIAALGAAVASLGAFVLIGLATVGVGLSSAPWLCGLMMAVNGLSAVVFNVVFGSLRQGIVPDRLLGRINGTILLVCYGAMPVGGLLGGFLAQSVDVRAPLLVAGVLIAVLALAATPVLTNKAIDSARTAVDSSPV
jgi:MFS family permease